MLNHTAARRRPLSRVGYAAGLLALIGAATALVVVVRVPAHSTTHLTAPAPPSLSAHGGVPAGGGPADLTNSGTVGHRNGTGAGQRDNVPSPPVGSTVPTVDARRAAPPRGAGPDRGGGPPEDLHRSLVWSGLLGLAISLTGLGIVGSRRRRW
ncbi:hypothetical protein GA0074692_5064 [Micromonospora pallida]|uniref:Uncharacterized protein n=2 Tax=Micromonospora pallida TaxID=145854 RepID=A0A1C6TA87_9ACTN|nr:hypothetical protein GA0074692_5064 [Micromonospora pallida]